MYLIGKEIVPDGALGFDGENSEEPGCINFRLSENTPPGMESKTITITLKFVFEQWNAP